MIFNPVVVNITVILSLFGLLITVFFAARGIGFKAGQKTNGYVKQATCDEKHNIFLNKQEKETRNLHEKINNIASSVARVEGYLMK